MWYSTLRGMHDRCAVVYRTGKDWSPSGKTDRIPLKEFDSSMLQGQDKKNALGGRGVKTKVIAYTNT